MNEERRDFWNKVISLVVLVVLPIFDLGILFFMLLNLPTLQTLFHGLIAVAVITSVYFYLTKIKMRKYFESIYVDW